MYENSLKNFLANLVKIALPIALQNFVSSAVNMLDTVMVGQLGEAALAAVGLGNQIFFLLVLLVFGITSGGGVFTAQYWGARDVPGIRRTVGLSLSLAVAISTIFTALSIIFPAGLIGIYSKDPEVIELGAKYLRVASLSFIPSAAAFSLGLSMRSVEKVRLPLVGTIVSLSINAFLNWVFIFGKFGFPAMGVVGAAWATVIARVIELGILWIVARSKKYVIFGHLREMRDWSRLWLSRFASITAPVIANEVAWSLGITTYNAVFARAGTAHLAAYNVANTVSQLAMVLFLGTANAAAVMIGKKIGEGREDLARSWASRFAFLSPIIGLGVGLLIIPVRQIVPFLFRLDVDTLGQVSAMLMVLAAVFPFRVFNLHVIVGICRSGGDTVFGLFYDLIGLWAVGVPLAAFGAFVLHMPAWGIFLMTMVEEVLKTGFGLWRFLSGKWLKKVV